MFRVGRHVGVDVQSGIGFLTCHSCHVTILCWNNDTVPISAWRVGGVGSIEWCRYSCRCVQTVHSGRRTSDESRWSRVQRTLRRCRTVRCLSEAQLRNAEIGLHCYAFVQSPVHNCIELNSVDQSSRTFYCVTSKHSDQFCYSLDDSDAGNSGTESQRFSLKYWKHQHWFWPVKSFAHFNIVFNIVN